MIQTLSEIALLLTIVGGSVHSQSIWDYEYTNAVNGPPFPFVNPMNGFFRPPVPPQLPFQPSNWHPTSTGSRFAAATSMQRPNERNHHLPAPVYRASAVPKWSGNPWVVPDSLMTSTEPSNRGDLDSLLARLVTRLPAIADGLSRIVATTTPIYESTPWEPWLRRSVSSSNNDNRDIVNGKVVTDRLDGNSFNTRRAPSDGSTASIVNSMPAPDAFFSFGKLISAFTGSSLNSKSSSDTNPEDETVVDVESIKGVPILKDDDQEPEVVEKSDEVLFPLTGLPSTTITSGVDETDEPFIFTVPPTSIEQTVKTSTVETTTENPTENLLGSFLNGKLDRVDWLGSIFGNGHSQKTNEKSNGGDGNALSQLFSHGFFGSGLSTDDEKRQKHEDRNFH
ncbi:hypothetical protein M3Y95_00519800 [Aphelenchoides besseyi]|nr:hypothetical protein M3Y95_00519800 [Aphelenchoides besseyi]